MERTKVALSSVVVRWKCQKRPLEISVEAKVLRYRLRGDDEKADAENAQTRVENGQLQSSTQAHGIVAR